MGEPGFFSLLIESDFVVYRNEGWLIFDSLILDFVITTESEIHPPFVCWGFRLCARLRRDRTAR
jgi:hypothetical protein